MKRVIEEIQERVRRFARSQRVRLMFVLCEPEHSPLFLKSVDAVEADEDVPDIFLTFVHAFRDAASFVEEMLETLREEEARLNEELARQGQPPRPSTSANGDDNATSPELKLFRAMRHVRGLVPKGANVVWVLYPLEITGPELYREFMLDLETRLDSRALQGTRVIARDSAVKQIVSAQLEDRAGVQVYRPQLDLASLEKTFAEQANDPRTPVEEQAQLHMLLAGMDVANGRHERALQRNVELLGYFRQSGQTHMESTALANIGDIFYLNKKYTEAQGWYEHALRLSMQLELQPMVMYQSVNLGNALFMQQKYEEALVYYDAAAQLAEASNALPYQVQALERVGQCHLALERTAEAEEVWQRARELSQPANYEVGQRTVLEDLVNLYRDTGKSDRMIDCQRELAALPSGSEF